MKELNGRKYTAKIDGFEVDGIIFLDDTDIYLLHNNKDAKGAFPPCYKNDEYKYGWWVHSPNEEDLEIGGITDFKLLEQ